MAQDIEFIENNPKADIEDLINEYQKETETTLYPAQDARIMLNVIAYYASLMKAKVNDSAKLNLVEFSRKPILDFLGAYKNCYRTKPACGIDRLKIKLNKTFSYDITIAKGYEVKTNDSAYVFKTTEDCTIKALEDSAIVKIESEIATSEVNKYKAGEINTIVTSIPSFVESVENLDGVSLGSEEEDDDSFIRRILLAPEGFSCAGPEDAYIYWALSAHSAIKDVKIEIPSDDMSVSINGEENIIIKKELETDDFSALADWENQQITLTLKRNYNPDEKIIVKIPNPYKMFLYLLSNDESENIKEKVLETLNGVRPICDKVVVEFCTKKDYEISGTVFIKKNADEETVKSQVENVLKEYLEEQGEALEKSVVPNQIIARVVNIAEVYDFNLEKLKEELPALKNVCYKGTIGNITYKRVDYE